MEGDTSTQPTSTHTTGRQGYITNPFSIALKGINDLKNKANGVFILSLVLGILGFLSGGNPGGGGFRSTDDQEGTAGTTTFDPTAIPWDVVLPIIGIIALLLLAVGLIFFVLWGMYSYTAAQLAKGEGATIGEAFNAVLANFWRLLGVAVIQFFRLVGWYLLFIIPGFIMQVRYSLSGLIAFAEPDLRPSQVVSRSARLTKGAWFDTFGSHTSFALITLGVMQGMTDIGASSVMYRQLKDLAESGTPKPKTHILSYLLLFVPVTLVILVIIGIGLVAYRISS